MRKRWQRLRRAWWLAIPVTAGIAVTVGVGVRIHCDTTDVAATAWSAVQARAPMVSSVENPPSDVIRWDCREQLHEEPNPAPLPVNVIQVATTAGTVATGVASGGTLGYQTGGAANFPT
jgi:hypothetical protein